MEDLIRCWKCQEIPYDVLMMNCGHHLCVKCAENRLHSQHAVKSLTGKQYLVCQKCKTKTNLDEQSLLELQKAKKNKGTNRQYAKQTQKRTQTPINSGRPKQKTEQSHVTESRKEERFSKEEQEKIEKMVRSEKTKSMLLTQKKNSLESYGECQSHPEEPVMYYCFTCKIHCFCAQCILTGIHTQHDVKTISKSFPKVSQQLHQAIQKTKNFISQLTSKQSEIIGEINDTKNKADQIKKSIQKGFDEIRVVIRRKQLQFMKIIDAQFTKSVDVSNGVVKKQIQQKIKEQRSLLDKITLNLQKGESHALNLYSDSWPIIKQTLSKQSLSFLTTNKNSNEIDETIMRYVQDIKNAVEKVVIVNNG